MSPLPRLVRTLLSRPPASPSRRVLARGLLGALGLAGLLLASLLLYACASSAALDREIRDTPRDPETGVVLGTGARTLTPPGEDTPTSACLLLHGFVGSRQDFGELGPRLAEAGYRVRLTRLPGHGTTPREFAALEPEAFIEHVAAELAALRADHAEVNLVGFSMGGALATLAAAEHRVDRLVLLAPYFGVTYEWYYVLPPEAWNTMLGGLVPYVLKMDMFTKVNRPEARGKIYSYRAVPTAGAATLMELGRRARQPEVLGAIDAPTLMVMSVDDGAASPKRAREAFDALASPRKKAVWIDARSNHILLWDYDREQVTEAVLDFLAGG